MINVPEGLRAEAVMTVDDEGVKWEAILANPLRLKASLSSMLK